MKKCVLTVQFSEDEMAVMDEICQRKHTTKNALLRQCLRLYQLVDVRMNAGQKLFFEDKENRKSEMIIV
jgi:hypothetical protein